MDGYSLPPIHMKQLLSSLLILIFFQLGCGNKESTGVWKDVTNVDLKGTVFETDDLTLPVRIVVSKANNLMAIINRGGMMVSLYKLSDGAHVKSFGRQGDGPGEFLNVGNVQFLEGGKVAVLGTAKKKFSMYSLSSLYEDENPMPFKTINLGSGNITQPQFLGKDLIADTRFNYDPDSIGRLNFFNTEGKNIKVTGSYPETNVEMSPVHLTQSYNSFWDNDEASKRIVLSHTYTDMIEVYDTEGSLINRVSGPDYFAPNLGERKVGEGSMFAPIKGSKVGYFANRVGPKGILALYSGEPFASFSDRITELIHFDLDGQPKTRFQLDLPVFHFDVDWQSQTIYALSMEVNQDGREFAVLTYDF